VVVFGGLVVGGFFCFASAIRGSLERRSRNRIRERGDIERFQNEGTRRSRPGENLTCFDRGANLSP